MRLKGKRVEMSARPAVVPPSWSRGTSLLPTQPHARPCTPAATGPFCPGPVALGLALALAGHALFWASTLFQPAPLPAA